MLVQRVATAAVGLPIFLGLVLIGDLPFAIGVGIALAIATAELYRASGFAWSLPGPALGIALSATAAIAAFEGNGWPMGMAAAMIAVPLLWPVLAGRAATALQDWSIVAGGALYAGWLGSHAVLLRELPDGRDWLLLALFSVWITDSAAYFVGRAMGQRKLAPSISPGKTWEGAVAGMAGGIAAVIALHVIFDLDATALEVAALAAALPIVAQVGDLAESALKRSWGVKDTGWLLPGHGGFLDRIDSLLFVAPVVYYWVRWVVM